MLFSVIIWRSLCFLCILFCVNFCDHLLNLAILLTTLLVRFTRYSNIFNPGLSSPIQIARLQAIDSEGSEVKWVEGFRIGCVIEGKIQEVKDIGVVVSFEKYHDVFGFITHYQCKFVSIFSFC